MKTAQSQSPAQGGFSHEKHRQDTRVPAVFARLIIFHAIIISYLLSRVIG